MSSSQMKVGGAMEGEVTEEIRGFVDLALDQHNSSSNDERKVVVEIQKVSKQVVSGMKYIVELVAEGEQSKKQYSCLVELWSQPWISPQPQVLKFQANPRD